MSLNRSRLGAAPSARHMSIINRNKNDEWGTPPDIYERACRTACITPVLDVCAAPHNAKCSRVREFVSYGFRQSRLFHVNGVFLTFAKTDTRWWHDIVEPACLAGHARYFFVRGRIKFLQPDGTPAPAAAPYPSVIIAAYGRRP